jgi:acyl carrier protein
MSEIRTAILQAIAHVAPDADLDGLDPGADLREELDIDSMDFLGVLVGINERLGVEVPEEDYGRVRTLAALEAYVGHRRVHG